MRHRNLPWALLGPLLALGAGPAGGATIEATANVGMGSNYLWRGVTQSDDQAALSGGLDLSHASGLYAGAWSSSLDGGQYELDLYAGYAAAANGLAYDLGVIHYRYPVGDAALDFEELYLEVGMGPFTAGLAWTFHLEDEARDEGDLYTHIGGELPLRAGLAAGLVAGRYDFEDAAAEDYSHLQLYLSKEHSLLGRFTFAVDRNTLDDSGAGEDDPRVSISWGTEFEL